MLQYTILDKTKKPFVIYKDTLTNKCCLEPRRGIIEKRIMIISIPRSGVHLFQKIFTTMGFSHVRMSFNHDTLDDYRFLSDEDRINFSRLHDRYTIPFADAYNWISPGQMLHVKIPYDEDKYFKLRDSDYVVYLLKRNLRDCIVSHARQKYRENLFFCSECDVMTEYIKMMYYKEISEQVKLLLPWFENRTFDVIQYEDLMALTSIESQSRCITGILEDVDVRHVQVGDIINNCIEQPTFSYTGNITRWCEYWSPPIETWFETTGLKKMNSVLGYD